MLRKELSRLVISADMTSMTIEKKVKELYNTIGDLRNTSHQFFS